MPESEKVCEYCQKRPQEKYVEGWGFLCAQCASDVIVQKPWEHEPAKPVPWNPFPNEADDA